MCGTLLEQGLIDGLSGLIGLVSGGSEMNLTGMIFDQQLLTQDLLSTGFREVRRWDRRTIEHGHIDDFSRAYIPHMDKENGKHVSLNLEGVK